jgi:hypothetical protein
MRWPRLRLSDSIALRLWAIAITCYIVAAAVAPEGQCDSANHDLYVSKEARAGLALLAAALATGVAGALLGVGALRRGGHRANIVRGLAGLASIGIACFLGFFALLGLASLACTD